MKKCTKCNQVKDESFFGSHKLTKDKLQCHCKECINLNSKKHRENNPEWSRNHYLSKQEYYKKLTLDRYKNNREVILNKQKEYATKHRDQINKYHRERRENNPNTRLANTLRSKISKNIKRLDSLKDQNTLNIVGLASWDDLKIHIESQFKEGMSWNNYGIGKNNTTWHIDHIIPISSANTLEEVKKLNHYSNLRPMWGSDNIRKSNKILGD